MSAMTLEYLAKTDRWTLKIAFSTLLSESDIIHITEVVDANLHHEVSILKVKAVMTARHSGSIVVYGVRRRHVYFLSGVNKGSP